MPRKSDPYLPYGRHLVDDADISAVTDILRSDWLTTGPTISKLENAFARVVRASECVAVSSGTAGLHCATAALGIRPGDEVIVPAITFVATGNAVAYQGGTPVFADVDPATLLIDPLSVRQRITEHTKAVVAVDYAGQPANYSELRDIAQEHGLALVADACHALGATYRGEPSSRAADISVFSLHPVKHVTAGEGGIVACESANLAARMRRFRNHGIDHDQGERQRRATYAYDMVELRFNYRLTDIQAALALSQLAKLPSWLARRQMLAARYDTALADTPWVEPLATMTDRTHARHLYVIRLRLELLDCDRAAVFSRMRERGIGVNVHYAPVYLHPFYRKQFGYRAGLCPRAEESYERILTLPLFPGMREADVDRVVSTLNNVLAAHARSGAPGGYPAKNASF